MGVLVQWQRQQGSADRVGSPLSYRSRRRLIQFTSPESSQTLPPTNPPPRPPKQLCRYGAFTAYSYRSLLDGTEHLALVQGRVAQVEGVLARVHSESMLGDLFGAERCNSGSQLDSALAQIVAAGAGVLVYLRGQQGRGLGLAEELVAYGEAEACSSPATLEDAAFVVRGDEVVVGAAVAGAGRGGAAASHAHYGAACCSRAAGQGAEQGCFGCSLGWQQLRLLASRPASS